MIYYQAKEEGGENPYIMRKLDKRHLDHPTHGGAADAGFCLHAWAGGQREADTSITTSDGNHGSLS